MHPTNRLTRRTFLRHTAAGMGLAALATLEPAPTRLAAGSPAPFSRTCPSRPNASSGSTWPAACRTWKASITSRVCGRWTGSRCRLRSRRGSRSRSFRGSNLRCFGPQHSFRRFGQSGQEIAEIFPHIGSIADDICIVRSLKTDAINHDPAHTFMNTGTTISGRPAMGSWLAYGLGCEADDLPGVLRSHLHRALRPIAADRPAAMARRASCRRVIRASTCAAPAIQSSISPTRPASMGNGSATSSMRCNSSIACKIASSMIPKSPRASASTRWPSACRPPCQPCATSARNRSTRSASYGIAGPDGSFGANCLMARRLAERGVRFIQLYHRDWDHHGAVRDHMRGSAGEVDQPAAALVKDLKARGMLDDTLVVFGSEFGRTPMAQGNGRDHHMKGFSDLARRRRHQGRHQPRRHGRARLQRRRSDRHRPRSARHDAAPVGHRSSAANLPLPEPRFPPDRRERQRGGGDSCVSGGHHGTNVLASLLARVTSAAKVAGDTDVLMKCTEPSTNSALTPPEWKL